MRMNINCRVIKQETNSWENQIKEILLMLPKNSHFEQELGDSGTNLRNY